MPSPLVAYQYQLGPVTPAEASTTNELSVSRAPAHSDQHGSEGVEWHTGGGGGGGAGAGACWGGSGAATAPLTALAAAPA